VAPIALLLLLVAGAQVAGRAAMAESAQSPVPTMGRVVPAGEAVLHGQVVEANSARPVAGALVRLIGGTGSVRGRTGPDGRFELSGVSPGSYGLSVKAKGFVEAFYGKSSSTMMDFGTQVTAVGGRVTRGLDFRLQAAGSLSGRITDAKGKGIPGVEVELVREQGREGVPGGAGGFAQTIEDGSYRMADVSPGDYMVRAYTARGRAADSVDVVYAPTFYPGVTEAGSAQPLRLYGGQELLDVDFALATSGLFVVKGQVVDPNGAVDGLGVTLRPMDASGLPGDQQQAAVDARGGFEIRGVAPGRYMLDVMDPRRTMRWVSSMRLLTVDSDVKDLELRSELGATVEGRLVRDVGATKALDPAAVFVGFTKRVEGQVGGFTGSNFPAGADGTFSLESPGGLVQFGVKRLPHGWAEKSVSLDGAEIDDAPIDFGSGRRRIEIVLTDKVSSVSGIVVDRKGNPLPNYSVVLFPPDASRWHRDSRFLVMARSDNAGRFHLENVPPGTYLAVAVSALPPGSLQETSVLKQLQGSAETIRLGEGQQLTISIRASPTPDGLARRQGGPEVTLIIGCRSSNQGPCR
jgi:protocatechuate 3,4-dioxygenase beta subunit